MTSEWTKPHAYEVGEDEAFLAVVADAAARHMYRAFDRMVGPLDRAAARVRSLSARRELDAAVDAMTAATATQDAMERILRSDEPMPLAGTLFDLCRALRSGPGSGEPPVLELLGEAALTWAEPPTAWAIAAAVAEMVDEVGHHGPARVRVQFIDDHLAIVANGLRRRPAERGRAAPVAGDDVDAAVAGAFLDRLATLLLGRVIRTRDHGRPGVAVVIQVHLRQGPAPDRP